MKKGILLAIGFILSSYSYADIVYLRIMVEQQNGDTQALK